jgi:plastocyanin
VWTVRFLGTSDVYDHWGSGTGDPICPGEFHSIFTDLDADGNDDTQVVYTTLSGMGSIENDWDGTPGYQYAFTYQPATPPPSTCAGDFEEDSGQFSIRFVDMLAEGWESNNSATWQYKSVSSVSIDSDYALPARPEIPEEDASQSVQAYGDLNQSNEIEGNHELIYAGGNQLIRHTFSHEEGISELSITTDYEENWLNRLIVAGENSSQCRISLSPDAYHCGAVPAGETAEPLGITISNTGTEDLTITTMRIDDETYFTLDVATCMSTSPVITPGENCTVNIIYHPTDPPDPLPHHQAVLTIESNNHNTPSINVPLYGTTAAVIDPGEVVMASVLDTIDSPQTKTYTAEVSRDSQICLVNGGALMRLSVYTPSGQLYAAVESDTSPICVEVVVSKPGEWQLDVTGVNIPFPDYPFELKIISPEDADHDGVHITVDNCKDTPNGTALGTCVKIIDGGMIYTSNSCSSYADCEADEVCERYQWDFQENGVGDACKCECDFDCNGAVDGADMSTFLENFGRSPFVRPCTNGDPCKGDSYCDGDVDAPDISKFIEDFGRSEFNNPCPACVPGRWCTYPPITVEIYVEDTRFDADNNNSTQIDTVTIGVGDTVQWTWREGTHTITNGLSSAPEDNPGTLFDAPLDSDNPSFSFEFTEPGTFPYFCRIQESLEMKGIIEVR